MTEFDYGSLIDSIASDVLRRAGEETTDEELVDLSLRYITTFDSIIEDERNEVIKRHEQILPETEAMMWMVVALILHDVLKEIDDRTQYSIEDLEAQVPNEYVKERIRNW